ncbi:MAG: hydroxyethylthiazole kinase [Coriobacteriales bacterium]
MIEESTVRAKLQDCAAAVRASNPMAPSITNFVTIDFVANAQLAVGGSAAMVYMPDEGVQLAGSQAMYLNMGTLMPVYDETIPATASALHAAGIPWVLDPVGLGIGSLRTKLLQHCKACKPTIIRCNASEAIALASLWGLETAEQSGVRGVDSTDTVEQARSAAVALARFTGGAVAVSGEVDLVTDGSTVALVEGGSPLMPCITGMGCSLGGVCAVFAACGDPFTAALAGTIAYNLAGVDAEAGAHGPASFKVAFIDSLYNTSPATLAAYPFQLQEA